MPGTTPFLFSCKVVFLEMSQIIIEENKGKWLGREKDKKIIGMKRGVKVGKS
jgi:hypothetical protein